MYFQKNWKLLFKYTYQTGLGNHKMNSSVVSTLLSIYTTKIILDFIFEF